MKHARRGDPRGRSHFHIPVLQGIVPLEPARIGGDVVAGLTLAALAIPEVMGYTRISETAVITGLYTILVPIAVFALLGSSRHLVVGADSATAAIIASALALLAKPGSAEWTGLASVLALLTGVVVAFARVARLGFLADFLSRTVLTGFLTGVGIQVALGELPGLLGIHANGSNVLDKLWRAIQLRGSLNVDDLAIAVGVIAVVLIGRKISRRIPGALLAVVGSILASWALHLPEQGVATLGHIPSGLPSFGLPAVAFGWPVLRQLLPTAVALAVVILAQSAATSRAYAWRYNEQFDENADLVALALSNVASGLSGSFVVNGSPTKTQMVDAAGGRTQLAQIVTAVVVLVVLLFLTQPLAYLPNSVLSGVVFLIGVELIDVQQMRRILAVRPSEFWVALITAAAVVCFGVERAIMLAMGLSLLDHVRRGYRPKNSVIFERDGRIALAPASRAAELRPGLLAYRFNHSMYYANAEQLSEQVIALAAEASPPLRWFALDMDAVDDVDFSAGATLLSLQKMLAARGVELKLVQASEAVVRELQKYGVITQDATAFDSLVELERVYDSENRSAGTAPSHGSP